jgi:hypothetical protein
MAKLKGQHLALLYAGYDLSGRSRSMDATIEYDDIDLTAFQDGAHNSGPALPKFGANAESFLDPEVGASHEVLKAVGGQGAEMFLALFGQNTAVVIGDPALACEGDQFQYAVKAAVADYVTAAWNVMSRGKKPDMGVVQAHTTITNTTGFDEVDNGGANAAGGTAYLQVMSALATDTYVVKVQHSATTGGPWVDYLTFTLNGSARGSERQTSSAALNQFRRALATRTGAAADSFKLSVVLANN